MAATGVFFENAALLNPAVLPTDEMRNKDMGRALAYEVLYKPHFIGPGKGMVLAARLHIRPVGVSIDSGSISLLTISLPPVVARFEAGLGDPRIEVRFTEASEAFGNGYTMQDPSGRISVRRDGDRVFIDMEMKFKAAFTSGSPSLQGAPVSCFIKGHADKLDLAQLTPWYGQPIPIEQQYDAQHSGKEPEYGSISTRCLWDKRPVT